MTKEALIGSILLMMVCCLSGCAKDGSDGDIGTAISSQCVEEWSSHMLPADASIAQRGMCLREFCATKDSQTFVRRWTRPTFKNDSGYKYELILVRGQWCPEHMMADGEMFFIKTDLVHDESMEKAKIRLLREAEISIIDFHPNPEGQIWWENAVTDSLSIVVGITDK